MAVTLSNGDRAGLAETADILLSPLEYPTLDAWQQSVTRRLRDLVGGGETIFVMPRDGRPRAFTEDAPSAKVVFEQQVRYRDGEFETGDPVMDAYVRGAAEGEVVAFTSSLLEKLTGAPLARSVLYNEVMVPTLTRSMAGLTASSPEGRIHLGIFFGRPSTLAADAARRLPLLELLSPAFRAGLRMLAARDRTGLHVRSALDAILEASRDGALVVDASTGREVHRNRALGELCAADPDFAVVDAAIRRVTRAAWHTRCVSRGGRPLRDSVPRPAEDVRTERCAYVVHATNLPPGVCVSADAILVLVEPSTPAVPSATALQRRFRLTAREAEVAVLIAQGLTDAAIASRLGLSAHTVGHHAERIFDCLGVHSRAAIPLTLLGARWRE